MTAESSQGEGDFSTYENSVQEPEALQLPKDAPAALKTLAESFPILCKMTLTLESLMKGTMILDILKQIMLNDYRVH